MFFQNVLKTIRTWWNQYIAGPVYAWVEWIIAWCQRCKAQLTAHYKTCEERIAAWYRHRKASFIEDFQAMRTRPTIDVSPENPKVPTSGKSFKIEWETTLEKNKRTLHCSERLNDSENYLTLFSRSSQISIQRANPTITRVAEAMFSIPGVESILIFGYFIWINKATVFSWDEIIPQVNIAMATAFGYTEDEIVDMTPVSK